MKFLKMYMVKIKAIQLNNFIWFHDGVVTVIFQMDSQCLALG